MCIIAVGSTTRHAHQCQCMMQCSLAGCGRLGGAWELRARWRQEVLQRVQEHGEHAVGEEEVDHAHEANVGQVDGHQCLEALLRVPRLLQETPGHGRVPGTPAGERTRQLVQALHHLRVVVALEVGDALLGGDEEHHPNCRALAHMRPERAGSGGGNVEPARPGPCPHVAPRTAHEPSRGHVQSHPVLLVQCGHAHTRLGLGEERELVIRSGQVLLQLAAHLRRRCLPLADARRLP
mmetsp:Transcript_15020/g.40412  ORF Transcript_15020/g.40412 Transcript_15020/m.40412 type:complete len:236 (-) Transcript_15020:209-916(-)